MKTHKVLAVGIVLAGMLLILQAPQRVLAQEPPPQDQVQQSQTAGAGAGSAGPRCASQLLGGIGFFSTGRRRRLGASCRQSAADHRRQFVG